MVDVARGQQSHTGDREENAAKVEGVLRGTLGGAARAAVVLNAGAAIYCADQSPSLARSRAS